MPYAKPDVRFKLDDRAENIVCRLVAYLVSDRDRTPEMGVYRLEPEMIVSQDPFMQFVRTVLELVYLNVNNKVPPTWENIKPGLLLRYIDEDDAAIDQMIERLKTYRFQYEDDTFIVASYATQLGNWMAEKRLGVAADEMKKIAESNQGGPEDKHQLMAEALLMAAPRPRVAPVLSHAEEFDNFWERTEEKRRKILAGAQPGPETPWPTLNHMIGGWGKGELMLISAKSGWGKSMMAQLIAEHVAWRQGGFNVALFHYEQYNDSLMARYAAKRAGLLPSDFRNPKDIDLLGPEWQGWYKKIRAEIERLEKEKGRIWPVDAAEYSIQDIEQEVARQRTISAGEGRELLIIHDYVDLVNSKGLEYDRNSQPDRIRAVIDFLRDRIGARYDAFTLLFAQDNMRTNYGTRLYPYNSQRLLQRAQVYVRLERYLAESAEQALRDGKPMADRLGRQVMFHDIGEPHSMSLLHVIKVNDGRQGYVPLRIWNGRMRMDQLELSQDEKQGLIETVNKGSDKYSDD